MFLSPVLNEVIDYPGDTCQLMFRGADGVRIEYFRKTSLDWIPVSNENLEPAELNGDGVCLLTLAVGRVRLVGGELQSATMEFGDGIPKLGVVGVIGAVNPIEKQLESETSSIETGPTIEDDVTPLPEPSQEVFEPIVVTTPPPATEPVVEQTLEPVVEQPAEPVSKVPAEEVAVEPATEERAQEVVEEPAPTEPELEPVAEPTPEPVVETEPMAEVSEPQPVVEASTEEATEPVAEVAKPEAEPQSEEATVSEQTSQQFTIAIDGVETEADAAPWLDWSNQWCVSQELPALFTQSGSNLVLTVPNDIPIETLQQWKDFFDAQNPTITYTVTSS